MRHVAANTTIPVPKIYYHDTGAENPAGLGRFIIMDYIEHEGTMSDALKDPLLMLVSFMSLIPTSASRSLSFCMGRWPQTSPSYLP